MTTRTVDRYTLNAVNVYGYGRLTSAIVATPGSCGSTISLPFQWGRLVSTFTSQEQTDMSSVRSFLASYVAAAGCEGLPSTDAAVANYQLVLGGSGVVHVQLRITLNTKLFSGGATQTRETWSEWNRAIGFFTSGERTQLQGVADMLAAKLASDEPLA